MLMNEERVAASFRDPSGFVFRRDGEHFRQVNRSYADEYDLLLRSGLYENLVNDKLLIPHRETDAESPEPSLVYKILRPEAISTISYPYEWCFSQLKDAARLTLRIQKRAMKMGMSLKDCSAYNIQFQEGRPILIDTLSFESFDEGAPWVAYRQFCQHFLAPLALMAYADVRLSQLLKVFIDGLPLDLASRLLPWKTRALIPLLVHIHLHAAAQKRYADAKVAEAGRGRRMTKTALLGLIDDLRRAIQKLEWSPSSIGWADYYDTHAYTSDALNTKKALIAEFIESTRPKSVWDLGANTGFFSRIASDRDIPTVAFDLDPAAVELNYRECRSKGERHLLPLLLDLTNPSPSLGWNNEERSSIFERGPADMVLALAIIHHLAISNNVPLADLATFFSRLCHWLVIEFVPKDDPQAARLLANREDIFGEYAPETFEEVFARRFTIRRVETLPSSARRLYLMERSGPPHSI
ncbi:MAG TPA: hypothetical protein VJK02_09870 [Anaerolineales bacterium]|nr:hypothetical protein [Anaerolineales bacterium]